MKPFHDTWPEWVRASVPDGKNFFIKTPFVSVNKIDVLSVLYLVLVGNEDINPTKLPEDTLPGVLEALDGIIDEVESRSPENVNLSVLRTMREEIDKRLREAAA